MPVIVSHALSMTTPDDPAYENKPSDWNSAHAVTLNIAASEISGLFSNANGVSFGLSGASITASHDGLTSQSVQPVAYAAANGSATFSTLTFANSNGVSFSTGTQGLFATVKTDYQTSGAYLTTARASNDGLGLNTAQSNVTWTANSGGLSLDARGYAGTGTSATNIGLTLNSNGLAASVAAQSAQPVAASGSNGSFAFSTLSFGNLNGLSFYTSNGSIVGSYTDGGGGGGSDGYNSAQFTNSTANSTMPILWAGNSNGSGNITMGLTGSTVTLSHNGLTTARASNDAIGLNSALTANGVSMTANSSGLSLNFPAFLTTAAQSNHSHGNPTLALTNINGTTASASNGLTLSLSAAAQSVQPVAASGSNGSFAFSTLSFGNLNGLSFYTSNGSIVGSYTDAGAGGGITAINVSAGTTSQNLSALTFDDAGGVSFGLNGSVLTASAPAGGGAFSAGMSTAGNTAGTSGLVGSNIVFAGVGEIALSQSVNGNSATLSIYENPVYRSWFSNRQMNPNTVADAYAQASIQIAPFQLPWDLSAGFLQQINSFSMASTSFATTANTTFSYGQSETRRYNIYTRGVGTDSTRLSRLSSTSFGISHSIQLAAGAAGTQYTMQHGVSYPVSNGTSSYSSSFGVSNASFQVSTTHMTAFTGLKQVPGQWNISLGRGDYWMGVQWSSTQQTQGTANLSAARLQMSQWALSSPNVTFANGFGNAAAASVQMAQGLGLCSVVATDSVAFSNISSQASQRVNYWEMGRIA